MSGQMVVDTHARSAGILSGAILEPTPTHCAPSFLPGLARHDTQSRPAGYFLRGPYQIRRPCKPRLLISCPAHAAATPTEGSPGTFLGGHNYIDTQLHAAPFLLPPAVDQTTPTRSPPGTFSEATPMPTPIEGSPLTFLGGHDTCDTQTCCAPSFLPVPVKSVTQVRCDG